MHDRSDQEPLNKSHWSALRRERDGCKEQDEADIEDSGKNRDAAGGRLGHTRKDGAHQAHFVVATPSNNRDFASGLVLAARLRCVRAGLVQRFPYSHPSRTV